MEIGERFQIPIEGGCGHTGRIVWLSEDQKTVGVRCYESHPRETLTGTLYRGNVRVGSTIHRVPVEKRNVIYLIGLDG
jgi:hypothetical protein